MENKLNKIEIYKMILNLYGEDLQQIVAMEECSELIRAISKMIRTNSSTSFNAQADCLKNLVDEIADVLIMIDQLMLIYNIDGAVNYRIEEKLERQLKRMKEAVNG